MDRASDSGSEGWGFESLPVYHEKVSFVYLTKETFFNINNTLRFYLSDGFWITPHHKKSSSEKAVRTDASEVDFSIEDIDDIIVRVFTRYRWLGFHNASVEFWDMGQLISKVNSGKCICFAVASYCAEFNLSYEFISRGYPVVATIDGCKYQITKQFTTRYRVNLWVLRCKEID